MREMTESEWIDFISSGTRTGKLGVVLPSGRPSVTRSGSSTRATV